MLTVLASQLDISRECVPFDEWLDRIGAIVADSKDRGADSKSNGLDHDNNVGPPAVEGTSASSQAPPHMLTDFFRHEFQHMAGGDVIMDTAGARSVSATLRNADVVKAEVVKGYVEGWRRMGFLG